MDSDSQNRCADEFYDHIVNFNRYVLELSSLIDKLELLWEGEDAKTYITSMRENDISELKRISDILNRYQTYMKTVPEVYQLCDEVYSGKVIDF